MTFSAKVKDEITSHPLNELENRNLFLGYLFINAETVGDKLYLSLENSNTAQKLFKTIKYCYHKEVKTTVRTIKRFKAKRYFIFELTDAEGLFEEELDNITFADEESIVSFIKGVFLAAGSLNDPKKSGYHLEITFQEEDKAKKILAILQDLNYNFKLLKREKNYMLYLKSGEEISDFLKLLGAVNALFYFEDIRIYRDHANMVNRLNNCEQANLEKSLLTSDKQLSRIKYIKENDYMSLLDDKTKLVAEYRLKYPEESFQTLADIISKEVDKKVSKSYVNHHFRKINKVYEKIMSSLEK